MFNIICDKCKGVVECDYDTSISEYLLKVDYVNDKISDICDTAKDIPLVYKCISCSAKFKYSFKELEQKRRESIHADIRRFRKIHVFKNVINPASINPDNGLEYCNICDGVDNAGNCYKDIISVCPFVKQHEA